MKKYIFIAVFLMASFMVHPSLAAEQEVEKKNPIEISAETTLEWDRKGRRYIAKGDVEVKQGDFSLFADTLSAYYNAGGKSNLQNIEKMELDGNVRIASADYTAYGDVGEYNIVEGRAVLKGDDLKIITPDETITAEDSLEYDIKNMEFMAVGNSRVMRELHVLNADILIAEFKKQAGKDAKEKIQLSTVKATGNVMISTPTEKIYGDKVVYNLKKEIATMTGNVRIEQGQNVLKGTKVTLNLKTGMSHIYAEKTTDGKKRRVTGVFFPDSK